MKTDSRQCRTMPKVSSPSGSTFKSTKLYCKDPEVNDIYIGATNDVFKTMGEHTSMCYNGKNRRYDQYLYKFIREHGGWSNWNYELVQTFFGMAILEQYTLKRH